ncbi:MAG: D-alanine--D-alanine ligase [Deltaproteobacteria bacterium]|nr:D-alanine--D-alanine ligase [Deltaproteobacteria bacterium]
MTKVKKLRVALLTGGISNEREISLKSGSEVQKALNPDRYQVSVYDLKEGLAPLVADAPRIDVALIILHGRFGEDGTVQGMLELLGIPYQGSGVLGSALAINKRLAKTLYRQEGLPVGRDYLVRQGDHLDLNAAAQKLGWPIVVKPNSEGSSIGVQLAKNFKELSEIIKQTFSIDQEVLIEEHIKGREITAGVLGNQSLQSLPIVEIIPAESYEFFDYEAKYKEKASREICPADLPESITRLAQEYALRAHRVLNLRGYSRTDMIVRGEKIFLLETNTIPGMTQTSLLPLAARVAGMDFPDLLDRLIDLALEDKNPGQEENKPNNF